MTQNDFDLIIVGGGMVGASLALALKNVPVKIALVEAQKLQQDQQPSYDDRGIALAYGSQRIFETMGLWSYLAPHATAIRHIHVSDRGHFGVTRLSAQAEKVPALGQVIIARAMGHELNQQLLLQDNLTLLCPEQVSALTQHNEYATIRLASGRELNGKLIVAADGRNSTIRQLLGLGTWDRDYRQTAITANITPERPHQNWAYERFTETGPIALLPMSQQRCSLVWTVQSGQEIALLEADDTDFLNQLQDRFGYRLGRLLHVGERHSHPLVLTQADQPVQQRVVLIGNAAHSLHPIAGQGFNLGLRDVTVLADLISENHDDCGHAQVLHLYKQWRQQDQDNVIRATDLLVKTFSNINPVMGHLRSGALAMLDCLPPAKSWLAQKSMGRGRKLPRLDRGISL